MVKRRKHIFLDEQSKIELLERKIIKYNKYKPHNLKTTDDDYRLKKN